jgi:acyl carrier protein
MWTTLLAAAPAAARADSLIELLQREVAAVLRLPDSTAVALNAGLFEMGMDSLMAVELRRRLERAAGQALPSTLTFNYPNVGALAGFLEPLLMPPGVSTSEAGPNAAAPAAAAAPKASPITEPKTDLSDLSEEELEARLLATLEKTR